MKSSLRLLLQKSMVALGLFSVATCISLAGCSKPVAKQKELTPESKEELRAELKQRAAREQEGF